ncbi:MAG: A/G-specific adenine glycosylase, partial [Chloroflexota bacterium]|nr:A/G-specific adenine glycosylase [Chloroflexota bacterium]
SDIAPALLAWADQGHLRSLPWRVDPRDPYVVWVSEVMLQQTQAGTVGPYLKRWLARFPGIAALAAAGQTEVLKAWEGLGYYSRARNLHKAAQIVATEHDGVLPQDRRDLLDLPGIGRYTAGAILSIAFGQQEPALDGNVKRVLTRLYDIEDDLRASATETHLWHLAGDLVAAVEPGQAGRLNETLMDLGATLCIPRNPRCLLCPLRDLCLSSERGTQGQRPVKSRRGPLPHFDVTAGVLRRPKYPDQFLIAQRPADGMLGGMWEFPGGKKDEGESLAGCLRRELCEELGIDVAVGQHITSIRHAYTHFQITLHAFECQLVAGEPRAIDVADWRWVTMAELAAFPFPVTDQKIIAALQVLDGAVF